MYDVKNHQVDNLTYKIFDVDEMLTITCTINGTKLKNTR